MRITVLPTAQVTRLARIRQALEVERRLPGEFHGKRFRAAQHLVSVPLGRRWRAIFIRTLAGYEFRDCLTHEHYNKLNLAAYQP